MQPYRPRPALNVRLQAEQKWQALIKNLVILRLAGIYGEGRNALEKLQTGALKRALVKYYPDGQKQIFSHIHVDDIAHAIKFCLTNRLLGIYNLCDNSPCPPDEVIFYAAKLLNLPPPEIVNINDVDDLSPMAKSFYCDNKRVSHEKICRAGFKFHYPDYQTGLDQLFDANDKKLTIWD